MQNFTLLIRGFNLRKEGEWRNWDWNLYCRDGWTTNFTSFHLLSFLIRFFLSPLTLLSPLISLPTPRLPRPPVAPLRGPCICIRSFILFVWFSFWSHTEERSGGRGGLHKSGGGRGRSTYCTEPGSHSQGKWTVSELVGNGRDVPVLNRSLGRY